MTIMRIRTLGDPVLKTPGADVESFDHALERLVHDMFETMYEAPGVGLAAPQVGLSLRLFVFDDGDGERGAVANPVITKLEGEQVEDEGCLSIPGIYHETPRAMLVRVEGRDVHGEPVAMEGEELLARIFQHETDHLNGLLYIDRLAEEERRQVLGELRAQELGEVPAGRRSRSGRG
ncbi:MAG TPA: peptide deformylase [Actinomycetota bacterium]|nr:peptide deformylase [Actinomycetota bacterium]